MIPERLAVDLAPQHVAGIVADEFGRVGVAVPLDDPTRRGHEQREAQVGRGSLEHAGRVPHRDAPRLGIRQVDVVHAHPVVADHLQAGEPVEHRAVDLGWP